MRPALVFFVVLVIATPALASTDGPPIRGTSNVNSWKDLGRELQALRQTLRAARAALHPNKRKDDRWDPECRGYLAEETVRCIAAKQTPPGGVEEALSVWGCESGWGDGVEPAPQWDHSYHGPYQYLESTYANQRAAMPDIQQWFETSPNVHDPRSNIITAVSWAARYGWGPWSCA